MKRLGFFVVLCLVISFFSPTPSTPFLSPQKAYAQTASEQAVIDAAIDIRIRDTSTRWPSNFSSLPLNVQTLAEAQYQRVRAFALGTTTITALPTTPANLRSQVTLMRGIISGNITASGGANTISAEVPAALVNSIAGTSFGTTEGSSGESTRPGDCSIWGNFSIYVCLSNAVTWFIKNFFLQIAGFFLWLTANMLNYAVQVGILEFSQWASDALYPLWVIVRQITSLFVLFAGLWIGFWYIIGGGDKFKRYIPWIIMFGLFVNFSYPLTRGAIDISNVIALNVYSSAVGTSPLAGGTGNTPGALIVSKMGLQGLIVSATGEGLGDAAVGTGIISRINTIPGAFMAVIFVLYSAWVFFMATALLVARTAVLVFLIVASPLLFVDSVIPKLGDEAVKLRKLFFSQLVVAPVFMIMLALTLKFLDVFGGTNGVLTRTGGPIVEFFNILMMLIMLQITLKVTKSVSGSVGEFATKTIGQVGGFAAGAATMGTGLIARGTIGRVAQRASESQWVTDNKNSFVGRRVYNLSNAVANSTFDLRNNSFVKTNTDKIGLNMGMGAKMGWREYRTKRDEAYQTRATNEYNDIKTYYTKDVIDQKTGAILHKKGDVREEGIAARQRYLDRETTTKGARGFYNRANRVVTGKNTEALQDTLYQAEQKGNAETDEFFKKQQASIVSYAKADGKERVKLFAGINEAIDKTTKDKLRAIDEYSSIDTKAVDGIERKVQALIKLNDSDTAMEVIKKGNLGDEKEFEELQKKTEEANKKLREERDTLDKEIDKEKIEVINKEIRNNNDVVNEESNRRKEERDTIEAAYIARMNGKDLPKEEPQPQAPYTPAQTWIDKNTDIPAVQRKTAAAQRMDQYNNPDIDITNPNQQQTQPQFANQQQNPFTSSQQPEGEFTLENESQATARSRQQNFTLESPELATARVNAGRMELTDNTQPVPTPEQQAHEVYRATMEKIKSQSFGASMRAKKAANDPEYTPPTTPSGGAARPNTSSQTSAGGASQVTNRGEATNDASYNPPTPVPAPAPSSNNVGRGDAANDDQYRKAA